MAPRISLITLGVSDLARARLFYEKLGFPVRPESTGDVVFFGLNGLWLALYPRQALAEDIGCVRLGEGFSAITLAHNVRSKEEVATVLSLAENLGGKTIKPAQDTSWGGFSGYFADPDEHLWEIAWNPFFWIE
ncbi:MAG: hypothetical protein RJA63_2172 [Pseudomonadota bacterium]|jgi:predicted lactoylglutathione lyase